MRNFSTKYYDGVYTLKNKNGRVYSVTVKHGLVYLFDGLGNGGTGATLEHLEKRGTEVLPFVVVPFNASNSEVQNVR